MHAPRLAEKTIHRRDEIIALLGFQLRQAQCLDAMYAPDAITTQFHAQDRAGKRFEYLFGNIRQLRKFFGDLAEMQVQYQSVLFQLAQQLGQARIEIFDIQPVQCLACQVGERAHRGQHAMPARFAEQRAVVTGGEVAVGAAQVQYFHAALGKFRIRQVFARGHDRVIGKFGAPVAAFLDNDQVAYLVVRLARHLSPRVSGSTRRGASACPSAP